MLLVFGLLLLSSVFWAPFFGTQAVRLLRESWGGILRQDPEGDYVEKGAGQLAEELYSMFDDNIPQTQNAPVTLNKQNPNAPGLTLNNSVGGNTFDVNGGTTNIGGNTTNGDTITIGGGTFNQATNKFEFGPNNITINNDGITMNGPVTNTGPVTFADGTTTAPTDPTNPKTTQSGPYLGKVVSGTGDTYQVALYGNGSANSPTATVEAKVPQIDPGEKIPAGTWVSAVYKFGSPGAGVSLAVEFTYEFQPPVWMT